MKIFQNHIGDGTIAAGRPDGGHHGSFAFRPGHQGGALGDALGLFEQCLRPFGHGIAEIPPDLGPFGNDVGLMATL